MYPLDVSLIVNKTNCIPLLNKMMTTCDEALIAHPYF